MYELKVSKKEEHAIVSWIDIFAGIVLIVEGINHLHTVRWFQPGTLYIMLGCFTITRGILHTKIPRVRNITFNERGFTAKPTGLIKFSLEWNTLSVVRYENPKVFFTTKTGKTHIMNLRRVENKEEVMTALNKYLAMKAIVKE